MCRAANSIPLRILAPGCIILALVCPAVSVHAQSSAPWINADLPDVRIYALASDPHDGNTILAGSWGNGIFRSSDGGRAWESLNSGLTNLFVRAVAMDTEGTVYAGTYGDGVFELRSESTSWQPINEGLPVRYIYSLATDLDGNIYAGTAEQGVYRRNWGSTSWIQIGLDSFTVPSLAIAPSQAHIIYAGTWAGGVFRSSDGGDTWKQANQGLGNLNIRALAIHPASAAIAYAGTWGDGVYYTSDSGQSWMPLNEGLDTKLLYALRIHAGNEETVFAGTSGSGLHKLVHGQTQWIPYALATSEVFSLLTASTGYGYVIYAGTASGLWYHEARPAVALRKASDPTGAVHVGDTITYTLRYTNIGEIQLGDVVITDSIPNNTAYVLDSADQTGGWYLPGSDSVRWELNTLSTGESGEVSFAVELSPPLTPTPTLSPTAHPTATASSSPTLTTTVKTPTGTPPVTTTRTPTGISPTPTAARSPTPTTPPMTSTATPSVTATRTPTEFPPTPTATRTPTTPAMTSTATPSVTTTRTPTEIPPTSTATSAAPTGTSTPTATIPVSPTLTYTPSWTAQPPTATMTSSNTPTATETVGPDTATPTSSPTSTATNTPVCFDALANGNFETGSLDGWETDGITQVVTGTRHFGRYSVMLGDANNAEDELCQFVVIPTGTVSAGLTYWWYMTTEQVSHPRDYLYAELWDREGSFVDDLDAVNDGGAVGQWKPSPRIDLTGYAGQGVWLCFLCRTDSRQPTTFYVDDIRLELCTQGAASQPSTKPQKSWRRPPAQNANPSADDRGIPVSNMAAIYSQQTGWIHSNLVINSARRVLLPLIQKP